MTDLEGNSEFKACLPYKIAEANTTKHPKIKACLWWIPSLLLQNARNFNLSGLFPSRKRDHPGIDRTSEGPE